MSVAKVPMLKLDTLWVAQWQPELIGTLLFVLREIDGIAQVLLIHKKTGHGQGRVNGPGGKLDSNESLEVCATREVFEEVGLQVTNPVCRAELRFVELDGPQWLGYAFTADQFSGEPVETPEAKPFWINVADIPFADMWPDDQIWLPKVLQQHIEELLGKGANGKSKPLVGDFLFEKERLLEHRIYSDTPLSVSLDKVLHAL